MNTNDTSNSASMLIIFYAVICMIVAVDNKMVNKTIKNNLKGLKYHRIDGSQPQKKKKNVIKAT